MQKPIFRRIRNIQDRRRAFLDYTINHYNSNNRAIMDGQCIYGPTNSSLGCAIGQHCSRLHKTIGPIGWPTPYKKAYKWMREMGLNFLKDIQTLHDCPENWSPNGLSYNGEKFVAIIRRKYNL